MLLSICSLLTDANPNDPLVANIAQQYIADRLEVLCLFVYMAWVVCEMRESRRQKRLRSRSIVEKYWLLTECMTFTEKAMIK